MSGQYGRAALPLNVSRPGPIVFASVTLAWTAGPEPPRVRRSCTSYRHGLEPERVAAVVVGGWIPSREGSRRWPRSDWPGRRGVTRVRVASVILVAAAICSSPYRLVPSGRGNALRVTRRPVPTLNVTGARDGFKARYSCESVKGLDAATRRDRDDGFPVWLAHHHHIVLCRARRDNRRRRRGGRWPGRQSGCGGPSCRRPDGDCRQDGARETGGRRGHRRRRGL